MKGSIRPLLSILMLVVLATTLTFRIFIYGRRVFTVAATQQPSPIQTFNSTLLNFAAIDIGEEKSKLEIDQLLERNYDNERRTTGYTTWRRFNHYDANAKAKSKRDNKLLVMFKSPKFHHYWLDFRRNLQDWARKKVFQPNIMMELVQLVKVPIDGYNGFIGTNKYKSCAIVGNSGILLNKKYGNLIDDYEIVIRLNNARIKGFEKQVGTKTNISFVNSNVLHLCAKGGESCFCDPYGPNVPIVMYICQPVHFADYVMCNSSHEAPMLVTDPRFDVLCARIVKYYSVKRFVEEMGKTLDEWGPVHDGSLFHYSSGFQAVMLALGICDKVGMFGFGKSASTAHHYHTNQKAELRLHDYEAEYEFYHDLVKNPRAIPFVSDKFRFPPVVIYR
ncbi:hypothetical protein V6Z11_D08G010200 [Gossypium hirsutum]|uniref:Beta-1,6-galactosyltransferase GALT29A n=1 Tax=Gossypium hirsutum TaxID=3635 RepID=A0A1U8LZB9_GOSHI|nr:beta-1,6-galactosyltransferase GALT29A-like [Gossypium hirsutum]